MLFRQSLVQAACFALFAVDSLVEAAAESTIIDFKEGDDPTSLMEAYDFCVVSFYNSEDWSKEVNELMEGAKAHFDDQIAQGEWSKRESIAWFRVDIEKHPDLSYDDSGLPDQLVVSQQTGLRRYLHYGRIFDDKKEDEENLALIVKELTGDFVEPIECDEIQAEERLYYDEAVYFGSQADVSAAGKASVFEQLAMLDRYNFDHQRSGFYVVEDAKCRTDHDLEDSKNYIVFFNGENSIPQHLTFDEDNITFEQLMFTLNTSIVKGTARWSQRSYSALYDFWMNGLVFLMEEQALSRVVLSMKDWRVALMAKITEWTQENESLFVPIIQEWDIETEEEMLIPSLAYLLDAKKEDVPHIYVLHSLTEQAIPYPTKLDDVNNFSPELVMAWAEKTVLQVEIDSYVEQLEQKPADSSEKKEDEDEPYELSAEDRQVLEEQLKTHREQLVGAEKHYDEVAAALKTKNEFAENLDDHFDVSESHMTRIEQAIQEEL